MSNKKSNVPPLSPSQIVRALVRRMTEAAFDGESVNMSPDALIKPLTACADAYDQLNLLPFRDALILAVSTPLQQEIERLTRELEDSSLDSVCRFYPERWFGDNPTITWRQVIQAFDGLHAELAALKTRAMSAEVELTALKAEQGCNPSETAK